MKRGISAAVMLICVFGVSLLFARHASDTADKLAEITEQIYNGKQSTQVLAEEWEKKSLYFSLLISHNHVDPISALIHELEYISAEDKAENCARIIAELGEIKEHVSLSLYTVF